MPRHGLDGIRPDDHEKNVAAARLPAAFNGSSSERRHERFRPLTDHEIEAHPIPRWIIDGLIAEGDTCVFYGEPGIGKSFVILDMGCHVALDRTWSGLDVTQTPVVYVAGEGRGRLSLRIRAWKSANNTKSLGQQIRFIKWPVNLLDQEDVAAFIAGLRAQPPGLLILDTLARNMFGGDVESPRDISNVIAACDRIGRQLGCAIVLVHHPTKSSRDIEHGSGALRGAADNMWLLVEDPRTRRLELRCEKEKDAADFTAIPIRLSVQTLPDGQTSLVVAHDGPTADPRDRAGEAAEKNSFRGRPPLRLTEHLALLSISENGSYQFTEWRTATLDLASSRGIAAKGLSKRSFARIAVALTLRGLVERSANSRSHSWYVLTEHGNATANELPDRCRGTGRS